MNNILKELNKLTSKELLEIHEELKDDTIEENALIRKVCAAANNISPTDTNTQMFLFVAVNLEYIFGEQIKAIVDLADKIENER